MHDEGVIKFRCIREEEQLLTDADIASLESIRKLLYHNSWIGVDASGIGYGNISRRWKNGFIITATQTGNRPELLKEDYVYISSIDIHSNTVYCSGFKDASSETMTHAVLYGLDKEIQCVIHIHDNQMWERLRHSIPYTPADVPYGTPEMADAVTRLYHSTHLHYSGFFGMYGHYGGLVSFDTSPQEAFALINKHK